MLVIDGNHGRLELQFILAVQIQQRIVQEDLSRLGQSARARIQIHQRISLKLLYPEQSVVQILEFYATAPALPLRLLAHEVYDGVIRAHTVLVICGLIQVYQVL